MDSRTFLISRGDIRDWAIILYCLLGVLLFFLGIVLVAVLIYAVMALKGVIKDLVDDCVKPTLGPSARLPTASRGQPISSARRRFRRSSGPRHGRGVRRGLGVLSGLSSGGKG